MIFKAKDRSFLFPVINSSVIRHIYLYFTHHYNYIVNFNNSFLITCVFFSLVKISFEVSDSENSKTDLPS